MVSANKKNLDYYLNKGISKTDRLNVRSFKFYGDGALGSRGAAMREPYSDKPNHYGALVNSLQTLKNTAERIADSDFHHRDYRTRRLDAIANAPHGDLTKRPALISQPVVIEDDVSIGIGAIILKGVRIGERATVGAGAVVTSHVPPDTMVIGNPAKAVAKKDS